jgi:ABC-2 type transport system ATP-binding protein
MENSVITVNNVTKKFGSFTALDNLSLSINENTCVGFLGPNGAGKTTLIKILTGLIRPNTGTVKINGTDVEQNKRVALSQIGALVETPEFYSYMTPHDILSYFGSIRGIPKGVLGEKIDEVLKTVKLENWSRKKIGKFSKGMKQRLALASALIHEPSILILDEPTTGLDPRGAVEIREIIKSLKNSGKTIFLSSHMLNEVQEVCDEVALVDKGILARHIKISNFEDTNSIKIEIKTLNPINKTQLSQITQIENVDSVDYSGDALTLSYIGDKEKRAKLLTKLQEIGLEIISFKTSNEIESLYMDNISESVR